MKPTTFVTYQVAVAIIVVARGANDEKVRYLLGKRGEHMANPGKWSPPAGHPNDGDAENPIVEQPYDVALRELEEETGMKADRLVPLGCGITKQKKMVARTYYLYCPNAQQVAGISPKDGEFSELQWFTFEEVKALEESGNISAPGYFEFILQFNAEFQWIDAGEGNYFESLRTPKTITL